MKNKSLLIAGLVAVAFLITSVVVFFLRQQVDEDFVTSTTDAGEQVVIRGRLDGWPGYGPLGSDMLQNRLRASGITLRWESDGGLYDQRLQLLDEGKIDIATMTVDAHQLNRIRDQLVGVSAMVIDESHGGDATLAWDHCNIATIDDLNVVPAYDANTPDGWKATYMSNTPSHQQVRTIGKDFGARMLLAADKPWHVEPDSDQHAFELFKDKEVCVATLWEPYVSKALSLDGVTKIYDSAYVDKGIVDVLLVRNDILLPTHPKHEKVKILLSQYFDVLRELRSDGDLMISQMRKFLSEYPKLKVSDEEVQTMIDGVKWINLRDNAELWFGVGDSNNRYFGLLEAHEFARSIITQDEEHSGHLAGFDFGQVINSKLIGELYRDGGYSEKSDNTTVTDSLTGSFGLMSDRDWDTLQDVGTLQSRKIIFRDHSSELDDDLKGRIDEVMEELRGYPDFRVELLSADEPTLATARGQSIKEYLVSEYSIDGNRLHVTVLEGDEVQKRMPRRSDESSRQYDSRVREVFFNLKTAPR